MSEACPENKYHISRIQKEDIPPIIDLLKANHMNYGSVELHWQHFFKVEEAGRIVGCFAVIPRNGFSEIKSLLVVKESRSFKLMHIIGDAITAEALKQNNPCVAVKTNQHNPAVLLYRRRGFEPFTEQEYGEIYQELQKDCRACAEFAQNICSPVYMLFDIRKKRHVIEQWLMKNKAKIG